MNTEHINRRYAGMEITMKKNYENIMWGILLILIAVYIVFAQLGVLDGFGLFADASIFDIIFGVILLIFFIKGIIKRSFGQIFFSLAFLGILFDEELYITAITPWTILFAALLLTIACNMIFPKKFHHTTFASTTENYSGEMLNFKVTFGDASKYINSDNFIHAQCECCFGNLNVYLDNAMIQGNSSSIDLNLKFGEINLYVPKNWRLDCNVSKSFGDIREQGHCNLNEGAKVLILNGDVSFGDLNIIYV